MPFTGAGKNAALTQIGTLITYAGLLKRETHKAITGVASTDVFTSNAHGYSDGDVVVLDTLTGGTGLVAAAGTSQAQLASARLYHIRDSATDTFKLAMQAAGTAVNFTTDVSAGYVSRLVEISGGDPAYARLAIAWGTAADGAIDDSTNGIAFNVPAAGVASYAGGFSAITAGTMHKAEPLPTEETYTGQGTYNLTDDKVNLNAGA